MSRRRTVDASTLLDLTWSTNHFPLPPPDGASPLRPARKTVASTSSALPIISQTPPRKGLIHSTPQVQPQRCLETPPRRSLVVAMNSDDDDDDNDDVPMSPRGAPDGRVEIEDIEEVDDVGRGRPSVDRSSRLGSLGGGRTETEDDEEDSSDEDDRSNLSDIFVREEEPDPFALTTGLPRTFNLSLSYEDRFEAYVYDILGNATVDQVHRLFKGYMEENILPNGWLGIWRSGGVFGSAPVGESTASVLVEIENVIITADGEKLEALATVSLPGKTTTTTAEGEIDNDHRDFRAVVVNHPGSPNSSIFNNSWTNPPPATSVDSLSLSEVESQLESLQWNIPLLDVHPVFQRHGGAKLTATALENVRFFYKHIWRAWDSDIAKDEPYASQCLQSRMSLHYDMEEGKVNPEDQEKYEKTVSQYEDVRTQLKALHNSMDVSDSENELDEADVAQCAALYEKEMALETAIQALENPLLRFLQHDTNFSKMKRQLALRMRGESCESVTHVVAKVFRARMTSCLEPNAVVEHHPTLTSAMENFCNGDVIHVHEGIFSGASLRSVASGATIVGQAPYSASPGPRRRPVQVSESTVNEETVSGNKDCDLGGKEDGELNGDANNVEGKVDVEATGSNQVKSVVTVDAEKKDAEKKDAEKKDAGNSISDCRAEDSGAATELRFPFDSNIIVDVDPESSPVTIANLVLRHLSSSEVGVKSQQSSPSARPGGDKNESSTREESICVKRGCLVLDHVTLIVARGGGGGVGVGGVGVGGVGISVHAGATLKMNNCVIVGTESTTAVLAHPDSFVETSGAGVKFVDCKAEVQRSADVGRVPVSVAAGQVEVEEEIR